MALIAELYKVEGDARRDGLDARVLLQRRQQRSAEVLARIEQLLPANLHAVLPASLLGKALHYISSRWSRLIRFTSNGRYPVRNNACENAIRPFVVGRRNWLG